ncbi:unannotated protein [freshwater metagenome]|uniref:Unannotated protein n=1 Tax=freshwater metagenome TaxID=449393 RepID=A0A6J7D852_9ZZZZ
MTCRIAFHRSRKFCQCGKRSSTRFVDKTEIATTRQQIAKLGAKFAKASNIGIERRRPIPIRAVGDFPVKKCFDVGVLVATGHEPSDEPGTLFRTDDFKSER